LNKLINKRARFIDLGLIDFKSGWDYQTSLFEKTLAVKGRNRELAEQIPTENYVLLCEHPHVYTLGKSGKQNNLLMDAEKLGDIKAAFYHINRGGDITYHGPGQAVIYVLLDLRRLGLNPRTLVQALEGAVIDTVAGYGVSASARRDAPGVYVGGRKLGAVGLRVRRHCSYHGLAVNVAMDLEPFGRINDDARHSDGAGLGLTIVRRFVALHGGAVEIRSNKARGTTVVCRLPVDGENADGLAPFDTDHAIVADSAAE